MTDRPVFLVSTGRTATRFFSHVFASYGVGVEAYHTTRCTRLLNVLSNMRYLGLLPAVAPETLLHTYITPRIRACRKRYIECNPYYYAVIPALWKSFPDARIVFLVRHPRDFVCSHIRWEKQRLKSRIANQVIPFWAPLNYREQLLGITGDPAQRVRYYSIIWARKNQAIVDAIELDDRARMLKYEDVFLGDGAANELRALMEWLQIPLAREIAPEVVCNRLNQTNALGFQWRAEYDEILLRSCEPQLELLGYSL